MEMLETRLYPEARSILEAIPDPIIAISLNGSVDFLNTAYEKNSGFKLQDMFGKHYLGLMKKNSVSPEDVKKIRSLFKTTVKTGRGIPVEARLRTADGRMVPVCIVAGLIRDLNGKKTHVVVSVRDLTEVKRLQELERAAAVKAALAGARAKESEKVRKEAQKRASELESAKERLDRELRNLQRLMSILLKREKEVIKQAKEYSRLKEQLKGSLG